MKLFQFCPNTARISGKCSREAVWWWQGATRHYPTLKSHKTLASLQWAHVLFVFFRNNCVKSQLKAHSRSFSPGSIEWHQRGALPSIHVKKFSIWESVKWAFRCDPYISKAAGNVATSSHHFIIRVKLHVSLEWHWDESLLCMTRFLRYNSNINMWSFSAVFLVFHSLSTLFLWNN